MQEVRSYCRMLCLASLAALWCLSATDPATAQVTVKGKLRCEALLDSRNLTLTRAEIAENPEDGSAYCYLVPLVKWVENGVAPERITATHSTDGQIDNERPLCVYPQQARYVGPAGSADNPANWRAENFQCH